jgi:CRISP-associated protein Cas1
MIKRVIEVGNPAYLHCRDQQLVICIKDDTATEHQVPIEDIGLLLLSNPRITISQYLVAQLMAQHAVVVFCDSYYLPTGITAPLAGHTLQARYMVAQADLTVDDKANIWQQIIRAKLLAQHQVLEFAGIHAPALPRFADMVQPGDPDNYEAQAASRYFSQLFGKEFRRDRDASGINALLNYGYAIMRAACARALVGAGLSPTLGVHHHNQYDHFCLADDIMEPLRPMIDRQVYALSQQTNELNIDQAHKQELIACLNQPVAIGKRDNIPLMSALEDYTASLRHVITKNRNTLVIPTT